MNASRAQMKINGWIFESEFSFSFIIRFSHFSYVMDWLIDILIEWSIQQMNSRGARLNKMNVLSRVESFHYKFLNSHKRFCVILKKINRESVDAMNF